MGSWYGHGGSGVCWGFCGWSWESGGSFVIQGRVHGQMDG